jgi:hypothetical protein
VDRINGRQERPQGDNPIDPLKELKLPPSSGSADEGPATQADLGPELNRLIGDFREKLGLPRGPGFLDDSLAPPVDMELVRAYVDRALGSEQSAEVLALSIKYRSWDREVERLQIAKIRAERSGPPPGDP